MCARRADAVPRLGAALTRLLVAWLVPGTLAAGWLLYRFGEPPVGAVLHALLLLALLHTVLVLSLPDLLAGHWPAPVRRLTALLLATLQLALLAFYAGSAVGLQQWGNWMTLDLARAYLPQLPALLRVLDLSPLPGVAALLLAWGALLLLHLRLLRDIGDARAAIARRVPQRHGLLLMLALVAALMWLYRGWWLEWSFWRAEPLRSASLSTGFWGEASLRSVSPQRLQRDRRAAEDYRRQLQARAAGGDPAPRLRPLVLVIVDGLRSDLMGAYGAPVENTPFLSSQLRAGTMRRVDDVYSVCTTSYCGILGTLASRHWFQLTPQPWNIADALGALGYDTRFVLSGDHTSFFGLRRMFGGGVGRIVDGSDQTRRYVNDDRLVLDALDAEGWPTTKPGFLYVHLMSAHRLGEPQPHLRAWDEATAPLFSGFERVEPTTRRATHARYHNGIRQTDAMIEALFERLRRWGVLDDAIVVITADHGEHLGEMGFWSHGQMPFEPGVRIPLLVHDRQAPGALAPRRLASQTDIAPTLLQAVGAPVPESWSGTPLQRPVDRTHLVLESPEATGLVHDDGRGRRHKYLRARTREREWLFRLGPPDGTETVDLSGRPEHAGLLLQLRTLHDQAMAR